MVSFLKVLLKSQIGFQKWRLIDDKHDIKPFADFSSCITRKYSDFVCSIFEPTGSTLIIDESDMNRIIGVTSSSPAYVFKFIDAIYKGAVSQGLPAEGLIDAICDVFIGSALLVKQSGETPEQLASKVASKGGTTERALLCLDNADVEKIVLDAMVACTKRADELGSNK